MPYQALRQQWQRLTSRQRLYSFFKPYTGKSTDFNINILTFPYNITIYYFVKSVYILLKLKEYD